MNKNKQRLKTNEAKNLQDLCYSVDIIFSKIKQSSNKTISTDEELQWKKLFNEKVLFHIDSFLEEISDDTGISYNKQSFLEDMKSMLEK